MKVFYFLCMIICINFLGLGVAALALRQWMGLPLVIISIAGCDWFNKKRKE